LEWVIERIRNRKLLRLFALRHQFLGIRDYANLIGRVFSYELSREDERLFTQYAAAAQRLARARAAGLVDKSAS
jgi:hypothetical protein